MALDFGGSASTDKVTITQNSTINDLAAYSFGMWCYLDSVYQPMRFFNKSSTNLIQLFLISTGNTFLFQRTRSSTNCIVNVNTSEFAAFGTGKWIFVGGALDTNQGDTAQYMVVGDLDSLAAVPNTYGNRLQGSGTFDDASADLLIGNDSSNNAFDGQIAWFALWDTFLATDRLVQYQFRQDFHEDMVVYMHLGFNGTGTQPDWSGNGNTGAVTGTSVFDHPPLSAPFGYDASPAPVPAAAAVTNTEQLIDGGLIGAGLVDGGLAS